MTTYLLWDDSLRSRELRHEIGEGVADPVVFMEHDGRRIVAGSRFERVIFERREDVVDDYWTLDELGREELVRDPSVPDHLLDPELVLRAVRRAGAASVAVPPTFAVGVADHLRAAGVEVSVDSRSWSARRRRKAPWELEGIERAQRAADTAMLTAARMLKEAEPTADGRLRFEGEILTAELMRAAMSAELLAQGAEGEDIIIHSGDAWRNGHDPGAGPIRPDDSCIIDLWPRDRRTGVYTDMTRTFAPGTPSDELRTVHRHCRAALEIALEELRPGDRNAHERVSRYLHDAGIPAQLFHDGAEPLVEGFSHALGHGVGLDVHEAPLMGRRSDALAEGDVVAVEPGVYFGGVGGVRLEDTVLVTPNGVEHFTDPFPYDLEP
jgi:Xaa-Pro aminopeptidase